MTVEDGQPYSVGEHFTLGDRFLYDPAEHGVVLPPVPSGVAERWSRDSEPEWELTIGEPELREERP